MLHFRRCRLSIIRLARDGFVFAQQNATVVCFFCGYTHNCWTTNDFLYPISHNPGCTSESRAERGNIPLGFETPGPGLQRHYDGAPNLPQAGAVYNNQVQMVRLPKTTGRCLLCGFRPSNVLFRPCCDFVACGQCANGLTRCISCHDLISSFIEV
ncbi:uncharacterized protein LOC127853917 [Dreissena polymorpha]|uniref:uncharacterized protein LOC127853917 n=1 Tax=Dreissena polymorpha TaxID=45954 RepID=UPI00226419C1|nr:uncharacterized protein LOC127853917 [Dreissena polymorpha]